MPAWYRDLDVYVCMSTVEGTPNPILEASACGIPWISTDVGIVGELRRDRLAPPGIVIERTPTALVSALERVLEMSETGRNSLGARGRRAVEAGWDWSARAEQFRRAVREVLR
jgi:glycosyltransferase involved in cell wall biosynthesis